MIDMANPSAPFHPGEGVRNHYVLISRDRDDNILVKETFDFYIACALQLHMLTGKSLGESMQQIMTQPNEQKTILKNLVDKGQDRMATADKEVHLFVLRSRKQFEKRGGKKE
jgi:hypothetical protein